jgi:hypothetical protein
MIRALATALLLGACAKQPPPKSAFLFATDPGVAVSIDRREIRRGVGGAGSPRDGIPAIFEPEAVPADEAVWLPPGDRVLGVAIGGEARAYPLRVLEQHEMVNDVLGGRPIAPNY